MFCSSFYTQTPTGVCDVEITKLTQFILMTPTRRLVAIPKNGNWTEVQKGECLLVNVKNRWELETIYSMVEVDKPVVYNTMEEAENAN